MKKRAWPNGIVEVPSTRTDPRADPQATQKISRAMLDDALQRTKSGMRPIVREQSAAAGQHVDHLGMEPLAGPRDSFAGPLDDGPGGRLHAPPSVHISIAPTPSASVAVAPSTTPRSTLVLTPRLAAFAALVVAGFVVIAGVIGFLAGRLR